MKKDLNSDSIRQKFMLLINMDEQQRDKMNTKNNIQRQKQQLPMQNKFSQKKLAQKPLKIQSTQQSIQSRQNIFTKGDIVKQISKLKPYLKQQKQELTTVELQNYQNKKITAQQKSKLSNVVIYLNKRLCEKLRAQAELEKEFLSHRVKKETESWIYQVFYRYSQGAKSELANTQFKNGYAVLTTIVELYQNLTFTNKLVRFNVSQIRRVKYIQQKQYQIIDIKMDGVSLQLGFLSDAKLELFDKMLFLLKNMARTSTKRLFQNQLIKTLYSEY